MKTNMTYSINEEKNKTASEKENEMTPFSSEHDNNAFGRRPRYIQYLEIRFIKIVNVVSTVHQATRTVTVW
jgi:hypothetical protein